MRVIMSIWDNLFDHLLLDKLEVLLIHRFQIFIYMYGPPVMQLLWLGDILLSLLMNFLDVFRS